MTKADFKRRKDEGISRVEAVTEKIKMATSGIVEYKLFLDFNFDDSPIVAYGSWGFDGLGAASMFLMVVGKKLNMLATILDVGDLTTLSPTCDISYILTPTFVTSPTSSNCIKLLR